MKLRPSTLPVALAACCLLLAPACDKSTEAKTSSPGRAPTIAKGERPSDPDQMVEALVAALQANDRDWVLSFADDPLSDDLSVEAFKDISAVITWLGALRDYHIDVNNDQLVAVQRDYVLEFEKGEVRLHITAYPDGGMIGFQFSGDAFIRAEHGALDDHYAKFKVYDFAFLDDRRDKIKGDAVPAGQVNYQLVLGGLEAKEGEHHVTMEKIVFNDGGKEVYHEPVEMDLRFEQNAEGIPRGIVRGFVYINEAGHYDIDLKIKDNVSGEALDYHHDVQVLSAGAGADRE